ncbi:NPP1-like protein [Phytophthora infestans T30-4]|uniref:NPP1-like protein n=1 Tax=Phytophthora infestans (strain T30-4) TaxID=403677 RepID=D0MS38_PHYIT|nr:NPP1-like protein [Phytophthora infestans T30-4]EEY58307.1 NPP1-like protein [Phytophthora infestans T30-4]|eukprot:XP_002909493.1 NPP1-like protein [Phytophthora infestans T30-4]
MSKRQQIQRLSNRAFGVPMPNRNLPATKHHHITLKYSMMQVLTILAVAALASIRAASIDHDKVQPFAQPQPITDVEKAAVKFKPSLAVMSGCHPYPAVNAAGETSAGLKGTGEPDGGCEGSELGSQVYSRSTWYEGRWAIMYAWYFPKDIQNGGLAKKGIRHDWVNVVVWLNNPAVAAPTILATSASTYGTRYVISKPPKSSDIIDGITAKLRYDEEGGEEWHTIFQFYGEGEFQDLIQWDQLTDAAREALQNTDFGDYVNVPFNDAYFETNLKAASTSHVYRSRRYGFTSSHSIWEY